MARTSKSRARGAKSTPAQTIGGYLIERLHQMGIEHIFGIPGDYVLGFYSQLVDSPIQVVGTTREDCAGFAADAYARIRGMGAVCVTYCVGGFNLTNAVAGAYAEKSPVVVISGAPGVAERRKDPLLHHRVREFSTQREVFDKITVASTALEDPLVAFREIDRVLAAAERYRRPVYIELPRDRVDATSPYRHHPPLERPTSDAHALAESVAEAVELLNAATHPVILAGVEVHRFGLQDKLVQLADKARIPMAATLLGKSVVSETHPLYLGIYEGAMGRDDVRRVVDQADCVLMLGAFMTDINLGIYTANLDPGRCIYATSERIQIRHHMYQGVLFRDFISSLVKAKLRRRRRRALPHPEVPRQALTLRPDAPVTIQRLFERVNRFIEPDMVVIADIGDSLFGSADLVIQRRTEFVSPAYYTSMGFAVPASIGAQFAAPKLRPLVIVGDGAFQMTGTELALAVRHHFNPIVLVLNNEGYSTERFIHEGPFNDIHPWAYHRLPDVLGDGWGFEVRTEGQLEQALDAALAHQDAFSLLNIHLDKHDRSAAMERLTRRLSKKV